MKRKIKKDKGEKERRDEGVKEGKEGKERKEEGFELVACLPLPIVSVCMPVCLQYPHHPSPSIAEFNPQKYRSGAPSGQRLSFCWLSLCLSTHRAEVTKKGPSHPVPSG